MSPENDFNINRVEGLQQIYGPKSVERREERKRQRDTARKRSGRDSQNAEETGEDVDKTEQDTGNSQSVDYRA